MDKTLLRLARVLTKNHEETPSETQSRLLLAHPNTPQLLDGTGSNRKYRKPGDISSFFNWGASVSGLHGPDPTKLPNVQHGWTTPQKIPLVSNHRGTRVPSKN